MTDIQPYKVSLIFNPLITLKTLTILIFEQLLKLVNFFTKHYYIILIIIGIIAINLIQNPFSEEIMYSRKIGYTCFYWILLGIASSIGLGSGLHTFVLYLGPHIAKVTLAANECAYFPEMNPNRWEFTDFKVCTEHPTSESYNNFWSILFNVQLEAFLWGFGTAIGELPPYFMSLGASKAGKHNDELEEIIESEAHKDSISFMDKAKIFLYNHLKQHGFITVLLCASVRK